MRPGYLNLMYAPPEGCKLANVTADPDFAAEVCAPDSLDVNATAGKSEQIPSALQGDTEEFAKPPVDLVPTVPAAGWPLL